MHCNYICGLELICTLLECPRVGMIRQWSSYDCRWFWSGYPLTLRPNLSYQYMTLVLAELQLCEVLTEPPILAWM